MEKVFDFIAKESDFLRKENFDKEIASIVRLAKEKSKEKKNKKVASKAEIKKKKKEDGKEEREIKEEHKEPMEVDRKEEETSSSLIGSFSFP